MKTNTKVLLTGSMVLLVVLTYSLFLIFISWPIEVVNLKNIEVFSECFGFINALFSGLAFAGLLWTILLQSNEIKMQADELQLTRIEISRQNFENTFFQILKLQHEIVSSITKTDSDGTKWTGRTSFKGIYFELKNIYADELKRDKKKQPIDLIRFFNTKCFTPHSDINHYFKNIYNLLGFIEKSTLDDKNPYIKAVLAQLSDYELVVIFYNILSDTANKDIKRIVEIFQFYKDLPNGKLINEDHRKLYNALAFSTLQIQNCNKKQVVLLSHPEIPQ